MDISLAHDSYRRFHALIGVAAKLGLPENARVLDVGGFPGTLRRQLLLSFPDWNVTVADSARGTAEEYLIASGAALPFVDNTFDLAVSSDTLEHVPPSARPAFLGEMLRVSRNAVILGAPFHQETTARIEKSLNDFCIENTGRPHPWLCEHVDNGLPSLAETHAALSADRPAAVFLNAPLMDWMMWQWMAMGRDINGVLDEGWQTTNRRLNDALAARESFWPLDGSIAPAYRAVIVAAKQLPFAATQSPATFTESPDGETILAWSGMMASMLDAMNGGAGDPSVAINDRLVRALELAGQPGADAQGTRGGFLSRFFKP